jgi:D-tyrosyl-tRNA(Tyr) deacylase
MRAVIQRVSQASVEVESRVVGQIGGGLVVLLAIEEPDGDGDITWLSGKIVRLRVFDDEQGVMNRSVTEVDGGILLISQFTLFASTRKGNRPSYIRSAPPIVALELFNRFARQLESDFGKPIQTGVFGAQMAVHLVNDGQVTLVSDTRLRE